MRGEGEGKKARNFTFNANGTNRFLRNRFQSSRLIFLDDATLSLRCQSDVPSQQTRDEYQDSGSHRFSLTPLIYFSFSKSSPFYPDCVRKRGREFCYWQLEESKRREQRAGREFSLLKNWRDRIVSALPVEFVEFLTKLDTLKRDISVEIG